MSKASWARLIIGCLGVILTGLAVRMADDAWQVLACVLGGFILSSGAAEFAFRRFAKADEIAKDLADRNCD